MIVQLIATRSQPKANVIQSGNKFKMLFAKFKKQTLSRSKLRSNCKPAAYWYTPSVCFMANRFLKGVPSRRQFVNAILMGMALWSATDILSFLSYLFPFNLCYSLAYVKQQTSIRQWQSTDCFRLRRIYQSFMTNSHSKS